MRVTSGTTALATSSATALDVITHATIAPLGVPRHARVVTAVDGFVSFDETNWHRVVVGVNTFYDLGPIYSVQVDRDGATDMTGVYASVWG